MTDIRRVHHRSSSKHENEYDYEHENKSGKHKSVSSRVVKKEAAPVSASSKRLKITVTNDRRSSISPPVSKPSAKVRSRSRSRARKTDSKSSKKSDIHKTKKSSPPQTKSKNKDSRKKKSRTRSPPPPARIQARSRSRSLSPGRYYNYPYHHYYDYYHGYGSRSRSRSPSRSPDPYRSKPSAYSPGYYAPPSRYRHMYPGMRYAPPAPSAVPYYPPGPPSQLYMAKFGKFGRSRYYPTDEAEFYAGPRYKSKKDEPKEPIEGAEALEEPKSPSSLDPELTERVCEITSAIANASAEGREYTLSEDQKKTLEKHQQLIQEYQQKKLKYQQLLKLRQQSQLNPEQMSMLLANKKFPNYRLLGRNIFEPNNKQKVFQKRIKTNTYYSRFIKQHPTNNLPLVFQKSIGLNEDKGEVEIGAEKPKKIKKKSKKKKRLAESSDSSTGSSESDTDKRSNRKKVDDVLEDGQIQPNNNGSESSGSESDGSHSTDGSMSNASQRRARRKNRPRFNNDARNGHTDSDSSMLDLKEHLKPIGFYIKNRERMLNEMFRCIKGSKLKAMLPDILKTKQLRDIKERCLEALECMSKKRIRCLLADQPMLSSSGTDESSEDEDNSSVQSDSDRSLGAKRAKSLAKDISKFRPIGAESFKQNEESGQYESNEDSQTSQPGKEEKNAQVPKSASGMAAAGFKNFVKKSISIKIKTNDQFGGASPSEVTTLQSTASQLTDLQKQQMAISNKLARKFKTDTSTTATQLVQTLHVEEKAALTMPKTSSDLTSLAQIRPQIGQTAQTGQGLLPVPNLGSNVRPGFISANNTANSYGYPPNVRMPVSSGAIPSGVFPPIAFNMVAQTPASFQNINPQPIAQPFQTQGQSLLGPVPTHLPPQYQFNQRYQDDYPSYLDEEEELGDDAAYDLDDNAYNYDLDEDLDSIINESRVKRKEKDSKRHRSKKSAKKHKRKKYESESDAENLDSVKQMLKNVLESHMDQLDESDDDLRMTLASLLDQIANDDGSLTYEDCVSIHESVKALLGDREEGEETDDELKRKKKKKSSTKRRNKSSEDLKPSKKKRKENGKRAESEEGEIDDVYDDEEQFIVEKEYQDLLK